MLKKLLQFIYKIVKYSIHFNIIVVIKLLIIPKLIKFLSPYNLYAYKHTVIINYLKKKYRLIINDFKQKQNKIDPSFSNNYPVWVIWWQGEESMPAIVKTCYHTLLYNANGHKVHLITSDNYQDYVSIPEYILKKVNKKQISVTHFSDILRMCLLYEHGGLWLDSTVLLSKPLEALPHICSHLGFWTPKDDGSIITTCFEANNWIVRDGRWLTFCFYLSKNNILSDFVKSMFFAYLKKTNFFIDYFLFDYFIAIAYDTLPEVRIMIDSVPENNPKVHEIYHRLNLNYKYNHFLFEEICLNTHFHKLNWKDKHKEYTENGNLTNYGYIINNFPPKF